MTDPEDQGISQETSNDLSCRSAGWHAGGTSPLKDHEPPIQYDLSSPILQSSCQPGQEDCKVPETREKGTGYRLYSAGACPLFPGEAAPSDRLCNRPASQASVQPIPQFERLISLAQQFSYHEGIGVGRNRWDRRGPRRNGPGFISVGRLKRRGICAPTNAEAYNGKEVNDALSRRTTRVLTAALCFLTLGARLSPGDEAEEKAPNEAGSAQEAIERGLTFLEKDALLWRKEHQCDVPPRDHDGLGAQRGQEPGLRSQGGSPGGRDGVDQGTAERHRQAPEHATRMENGEQLGHLLTMMAQAVPKQEAVWADELRQIAGHLVRHQEADGSWSWSSAPPGNRPPPYFESDEVATLLGYMALGPQVPADPKTRPRPARAGKSGRVVGEE